MVQSLKDINTLRFWKVYNSIVTQKIVPMFGHFENIDLP